MGSGVCAVLLALAALLAAVAAPARADPIRAFVVPHSHDDVGWIVTLEQYYTAEVQYIIDTVIQSLLENEDRRFIMVEVGYIARWFRDASDIRKQELHQVVDRGQLEFILGGVVMADEAAASYIARINQLQEGHRFLLEEFGSKGVPNIGWQIDPFGSSRGTPTLFAWDCFDALVIDRVTYWKKLNRQDSQDMEFVWHGTDNLGNETDIFTHLMDQFMYCTPNGFAFGDGWNIYDPPNPNPPIESYNIKARADLFVDNIKQRAAWYKTANVLWPFGCDFNYVNAVQMYKNMDRLIEYVNNNQDSYNVTVEYALLSDYFAAVHASQDKNSITWPEYSGDFFPYADNNVSYWSGFYTSRNKLKGISREADHVLRAADQVAALAVAEGLPMSRVSAFKRLQELRWQSGVSQHHDAISGTARPAVVADYEARLKFGMRVVEDVTIEGVALIASNVSHPELNLNMSSVEEAIAAGETAAVVVYNTLGWTRAEYVSVGLDTSMVTVEYGNGTKVPFQMVHVGGTPLAKGDNEYELWMQVIVPPVGIETLFIVPVSSDDAPEVLEPQTFTISGECLRGKRAACRDNADMVISNEMLSLTFDGGSGLVKKIQRAGFDAETIQQMPMQYNSSADPDQPSGAYIFRNADEAMPLSAYQNVKHVTVHAVTDGMVQSVAQQWDLTVNVSKENPKVSSSYSQIFQLFAGFGGSTTLNATVANHIRMDIHVGIIDGNRELISRWSIPSIKNNLQFAQDDSGFITMQRKYNASQSLPVPGNYYPMVSNAFIQDAQNRLTIISSQSEGCSSQENGELEVMLQRRTLQDDGRGVSAPLNETDRISLAHFIQYDDPTNSETYRHRLRLLLNTPPVLLFGSAKSQKMWTSNYLTRTMGLSADLPQNVHLLSFHMYDPHTASTIVRLQHLFETSSNNTLAAPVTINLDTLFSTDIALQTVTRKALSANRDYGQCNRMQWNIEVDGEVRKTGVSRTQPADDPTIRLLPSEIQTYALTLVPAQFIP